MTSFFNSLCHLFQNATVTAMAGKYRCTKISQSEYLQYIQEASRDPLTEGNMGHGDKRKLEDSLITFIDSLTNNHSDSNTPEQGKKQKTIRDRLDDVSKSIEAHQANLKLYEAYDMKEEAKEAKQELIQLCQKRASIAKELANE